MTITSAAHSTSLQIEEPSSFRLLPHNIEAEKALLGAILINNDALDRVVDFLKPAHFF
ncbi:replicative DNA helicase [Bartonella vinsonii]|uniref:Replicative DNA helicase n=1 Tax=Bartonella vinsonii TaxID=33047 RepID=A0A3S4ZB00_BARVI|nr:replicative DNA helicase [Bartonella vinsonii]VEJ44934.1 replicative DNA helicase [Bartonella vinsonii]